MQNYKSEIVFSSSELSARDKIKIKDLTNATGLDDVVTDEVPLVLHPELWCELSIHNEKSKDKDYTKYILVCSDGSKFATGSVSFWNAFKAIVDELDECGEASDFDIEVYRRPSKNYSGKSFLTCSLA